MRLRLNFWTIVAILTWGLLAVLLFEPVGSVLITSLFDKDGNFTLANYGTFFSQWRFAQSFFNTLVVGFGALAGALVLGCTMAFCVSRFTIAGSRFLSLLSILALVSPPFIGAYSWIVLFGAGGVVRGALRDFGINMPPIYGLGGILMVFALKFYPYVYLMVSGALGNVNRSLEEAAEGLGLTPWQRVFKISLPMVFPAISASALLVFVLAIADFGTPRLLGRGYSVLATEAFAAYSAEIGSNFSMGTTISVVLIFVSLVFVALQRYMSRRNVYHGNLINKPTRIRLKGWRNVLAHVVVYAIGLCGAMPVIVSVYYSFRKTNGPVFQDGFALQSYERILFNLADVVTNSLTFSLVAVLLIVAAGTIVGVLVARRTSLNTSLLDAAFMIPYVMPGIVIGIAYIAAFNTGPVVLTGTAAIIILSIFIRRLPYTVRTTATALRQIAPSLEEAAVSLGYSPFRSFLKITVPLIVPGIIAGGMLSFVTAINELSSSLVLYVGSTMTMPVRIYLLVLDGDFGTAAAMSSILLLLSGLAVYIAFRFMGRNEQALL
ncbi:MAG: ABC transporter permease [Devosia sp. 67-54]|uniref:ABC transporter permease n=1 Tax=unclassified Devosia TaxID=196773 RepID=UPI00086DD052|nr:MULTISPECIES: iron ABC transporter permease [unclassified Devosia]MBN9304645.1 iron ABC transporter permease [Devosia sp.]ODU62899.1 MAG: ABC transporter permease [Pelagibacterium sp. SCN 68-10]OJX15372.1 MAG: ABC transporter permease [Devosia sp. 67-54]